MEPIYSQNSNPINGIIKYTPRTQPQKWNLQIYSSHPNSSNGTIRYTPGTPTLAMELSGKLREPQPQQWNHHIYSRNPNPSNGTIRYTPGTPTLTIETPIIPQEPQFQQLNHKIYSRNCKTLAKEPPVNYLLGPEHHSTFLSNLQIVYLNAYNLLMQFLSSLIKKYLDLKESIMCIETYLIINIIQI